MIEIGFMGSKAPTLIAVGWLAGARARTIEKMRATRPRPRMRVVKTQPSSRTSCQRHRRTA
eukprot:1838571-Prymnesium_polylepis.1